MTQTSMFQDDDGPPSSFYPGMFSEYSREEMTVVCQPRQYLTNMYGRTIPRPRLESWFHDDLTQGYEFGGGRPIMPRLWPGKLIGLRAAVTKITGQVFASCFVNLYRNHNDSIGWHADDEPCIGPVIASVTLGATRVFRMRRKDRQKGSASMAYTLKHGDMFVMEKGCQESWEHAIHKSERTCGPRLNMTFRQSA